MFDNDVKILILFFEIMFQCRSIWYVSSLCWQPYININESLVWNAISNENILTHLPGWQTIIKIDTMWLIQGSKDRISSRNHKIWIPE